MYELVFDWAGNEIILLDQIERKKIFLLHSILSASYRGQSLKEEIKKKTNTGTMNWTIDGLPHFIYDWHKQSALNAFIETAFWMQDLWYLLDSVL